MAPSISVAEYYANKSIFITGATGFMGKILVEKLLRTCPDIERIYVLMRSKRGHNSKERLDGYFNNIVFDRLQKEHPKRLEKLRVVPGDILLDDLGISIEDREELQRVCQIIFHCAACVRFDMFLRDAVNMNIAGTLKVLELAEGVDNLEVFCHVSTAYSSCEEEVLEERLYPAKHRPHHIMNCAKWMDDELLADLQTNIIKPHPNTYAYTKNLAEDLVSQYKGKFPIAIARPSIVTAALKEPVPGWVDNLNGPTGLLVGVGKGIIRTVHCYEKNQVNVLPVDMSVNGCILLAYTTAIDKPEEIRFCNITKAGLNPFTWGDALTIFSIHVKEFPFSVCLWYPGVSLRSSGLQQQVAQFFTHLLPAYFVDLLLFLMGKKTFMVKMQKRISYGHEVLQYFMTKELHFKNDNYVALQTAVSKEDNETFYTDAHLIQWSDYIRNYIKGAREYCCIEDPATIPQARKLHRQLYYLDKFTTVIVSALVAYVMYYYARIFFSVFL